LFLIRICKGNLERIDTEVVTESERKRAFSGDNVNLEELAKRVVALNSGALLKERMLQEKASSNAHYTPYPLQLSSPSSSSSSSSSSAVTVANAIPSLAPTLVHEGIVGGHHRNGGLPVTPLVVSTTKNSNTNAAPSLPKAAPSSSSSPLSPLLVNRNLLKASLLLVSELSHQEGGEAMLKELSEVIFDTRSNMLKGIGGGGASGGVGGASGAGASPRPRTPMM